MAQPDIRAEKSLSLAGSNPLDAEALAIENAQLRSVIVELSKLVLKTGSSGNRVGDSEGS
jgi:hypothetical protein